MNQTSTNTKPHRPHKHPSAEINETTLKQCLICMAQVVDRYGDAYLPIFIRLKDELEKQREQDAIKLYAKQLLSRELEL